MIDTPLVYDVEVVDGLARQRIGQTFPHNGSSSSDKTVDSIVLHTAELAFSKDVCDNCLRQKQYYYRARTLDFDHQISLN